MCNKYMREKKEWGKNWLTFEAILGKLLPPGVGGGEIILQGPLMRSCSETRAQHHAFTFYPTHFFRFLVWEWERLCECVCVCVCVCVCQRDNFKANLLESRKRRPKSCRRRCWSRSGCSAGTDEKQLLLAVKKCLPWITTRGSNLSFF